MFKLINANLANRINRLLQWSSSSDKIIISQQLYLGGWAVKIKQKTLQKISFLT